ncbi:hypothetical protein BJ546DRAFT_1066148 [Cryomyces antarcticus]
MSLICRAIFIVCFCLLRFSGIASAQSETAAPTFSSSILPTTTARNGAAQTHIITVGKGNNRFVPDITQASVGDIIQFQFFPPNHSVIRAEYGYPCIPYEDTGVDKVGFFSGFKPVDVILSTPPTFELTINDTNPIFYYCAAPGSCINFAMVGVINPNSSVSLATQQALAHKADYMLVPGEHFPAEASSSLASLAAASTSTSPTSSAAATSTSAAPAANATTSHKLSTGAIVGIAIGGAAVLLLAAALFFFIGRSKTLKEALHHNQAAQNRQSAHTDMYQIGGAKFGPVDPSEYHKSGNAAYEAVPPYQKSPDHNIEDFGSPRSMSPNVPCTPGSQFGGFYPQEQYAQRGMSPHHRFSGASELGADSPVSPQASSGPHEMFVPPTQVQEKGTDHV